ncbi:hypothetical protein [Gaiella sp.]|uniref:hypothetical protein n=1 Tax=Gaiella sp. TaxID=2663207 RepID=UPI003266ED72
MTEHLPAALARQVAGRSEIAIRSARPGDAAAIRRLAHLVDRTVPADPVLVAETDGAIVAALSTSSADVVTDPFRATGDLVALLRLRSAQLHALAA